MGLQTKDNDENWALKNVPFFYLIHDLSRAAKRRMEELGRPHGLTMPQWHVLAQLAASGGMSQAALARIADIDPMTVSGIVDRLESKGLVKRLPDPADSRAKIVRSTAKARDKVDEVRQAVREVYLQAMDGLSPPEQASLFSLLDRISINLSNINNDTVPAGDAAQVKELQ